jgi:hypothetical protein
MTGPPVLDGRRAFYDRPQLTDYENSILTRVLKGTPLVALCERGGKAYYLGKAKVRATTAQRLINRRYVRPRDPGLLPDLELAQTYEAVPCETGEETSPKQEIGPPSCCDEGRPELIEKGTKSWQEMETSRQKSTLREGMERRLHPERTPRSPKPTSI